MYKKVFTLIFLISSFVAAQIVPPKISLQPKSYDFGSIEQGTVVSHKFYVSNTGGSLLKLSNIHASCGCTVTSVSSKSIAPEKDAVMVVHFDSHYKVGPQLKYVYITTNDPDHKQLRLKITANVIGPNSSSADSSQTGKPKAYFSVKDHDFGKVKSGSVQQFVFNFKNTGKGTLKIKKIRTSCGCTAAMATSKEIAPGKKGTIRSELDTSGLTGKISRSIILYTNDPKTPLITLMLYANVEKETK